MSARSRALRLLVATTLLVIGAVLGAVAPATAQQRVLTDPSGDVWSVRLGSGEARPARGSDQDLLGGRVRHATASVRLTWRYADLRPRGTLVVHRALLRSDGGTTYEVRVDAGRGDRAGKASVFRGDRAVTCRTRHTVDHRRDRVDLRVPRSCLGDPRTLRARLDGYRADRGGAFRRDNAHDRTASTSRWTPELSAGRGR